MIKTDIKKISADWTEVKNECRHTTNKEDTDTPATEKFIKKVLISEHSPIRLVKVKWRWAGLKSWISVHFARHWLGWDKWISTQRTDRTGVDRDAARQDTPVNMDIEANPQALINVARFRLCKQASDETRDQMVDLKFTFEENEKLKEIAGVLVPNCIYRCGCPEFTPCGFWAGFVARCKRDGVDIFDIQQRYDKYTEVLHEMEGR